MWDDCRIALPTQTHPVSVQPSSNLNFPDQMPLQLNTMPMESQELIAKHSGLHSTRQRTIMNYNAL